jgi:BirA family biotin operon repressor/biotin-[acetyl-CoA-carboxylase] ligase
MDDSVSGPALEILPLATRVVGRTITWLETVPSTNTLALECRRDGAVYGAETQTAGRGRHGNRWESAPGLGLWFSVCLSGPPDGLMFAGALAVRRATKNRVTLNLKWPNDLWCNGRKVSGVLVEHREGWNALGIGINVHQRAEDFPEALRETAGALDSQTDQRWDRSPLLHEVLTALDDYVRTLRRGGLAEVHAEWAATSGLVGQTICRAGRSGRVVALELDGTLVLETAAGLRRIASGGGLLV